MFSCQSQSKNDKTKVDYFKDLCSKADPAWVAGDKCSYFRYPVEDGTCVYWKHAYCSCDAPEHTLQTNFFSDSQEVSRFRGNDELTEKIKNCRDKMLEIVGLEIASHSPDPTPGKVCTEIGNPTDLLAEFCEKPKDD